MDPIHIWIGSTMEMDPLQKEMYPSPMKWIVSEIKKKLPEIFKWILQLLVLLRPIDPPKKLFLMENLNNPKHLMAKSVTPIPAQGLISPYVKICS